MHDNTVPFEIDKCRVQLEYELTRFLLLDHPDEQVNPLANPWPISVRAVFHRKFRRIDFVTVAEAGSTS
jgi:hypothetical protein